MTIRGARGCFNGLVIGIEFAVLDIFANGAIEEEGFLADDGDVMAQGSQGCFRYGLAIDGNLAARVFVKGRQQAHQRAFARARGADERDHLARLSMQGNVLEHGAVGFVRKKNILVDHLTAYGLG